MPFDVVDRQPGGNTGEISIGLAGEATEIWTIVADSVGYTTENLRYAGLWGTPYESYHAQNPRLLLRPVKIVQDESNPALFICTLTWTSEPLTPAEKEQKETNPLDRKPRFTVKTARSKEANHRDFYGKAKVDAAGSLFDPPLESDVSFKIITVRKNVTVFPDWVFEFDNSVNSVPFVIKGRPITKGCAYLANVELGEENNDGLIPYCEARAELWIKKRRKAGVGEDPNDVPDPWEIEQLNEGLFKLVAGERIRIKVKDDDGAMVFSPGPVPLTLAGDVLDPVTVDNATYIVFRDHEELDFNLIAAYLWS